MSPSRSTSTPRGYTGRRLSHPEWKSKDTLSRINLLIIRFHVPNSVNAITHLKHLNKVSHVDKGKVDLPLYQPDEDGEFEPKELISMEDLEAIEGDYQR